MYTRFENNSVPFKIKFVSKPFKIKSIIESLLLFSSWLSVFLNFILPLN